jgi:O-antigen/teichoic acid export membrane protein
MRAEGLVRSGLFVAGAVVVANTLNAVFQFVMARLLEPAEYSLLATLFVVIVVMTIPAAGLQAGMARDVARRLQDEGPAGAGAAVKDAFAAMGRWIAVAVAAIAISAVPLIELLHIERPLPFLATAVAIAVALPLPLVFGALQGSEQFGTLSLALPAFSAVKLIVGATLALVGFGASAVTFGVAAATVLTMLVALLPLRRMLRAAPATRMTTAPSGRALAGYSAAAAVGYCAYAAHTSSDIIVARLSFDAATAGEWAAAAVTAKTILLIPIAVTTVLFPRVAVLRNPARERAHMLAGIGVVAAVGLIAATLMAVFAGPIVQIAFGPHYANAAEWLGLLAFPMVLYAVVQIYLFHFLAVGLVRYSAVMLAFLGVQLGLFALFHGGPMQLILVQAISATLLIAAGELALAWRTEEKALADVDLESELHVALVGASGARSA